VRGCSGVELFILYSGNGKGEGGTLGSNIGFLSWNLWPGLFLKHGLSSMTFFFFVISDLGSRM
jgi:hypothetical protein